jgi:NAD(P)-dependent dehydrogenase (short-subunit alcohol dehydrogenase family)
MIPYVFISGGSKGMGKAIVSEFLRKGWKVVTCARRVPLKEVSSYSYLEKESNLFWYPTDLSDLVAVEAMVASILKDHGTPSIIVNNAGIYETQPFESETIIFFEKTWAVNFLAPRLICQRFGNAMLEKRQGRIINICSIASQKGIPQANAYTVSKHALLGLTRALREEWKANGIGVTAILPGSTISASWEGSDIDPQRLIQPEDIAQIVYLSATLSPSAVAEEILIRPFLGDL